MAKRKDITIHKESIINPLKFIKEQSDMVVKKPEPKKQLAVFPIKNENDIVKLINKMDDVEYIKKNILEFDKTVIKIKLEGKEFNSSMSGSFIIGLAKYQEAIYKMYLINKYGTGTKRKITPEEAQLIDIKVTVKKGSTDAIIELAYNLLKEAIKTMPPEHVMPTILGLAAIIVGGICLNGIGSKIITGAFKKKKEEIKSKNNQSKDDLAKKQIETHESIINNAMEAVKSMSEGILKSNPERIYINDKEVSGKNIQAVADSLIESPEKPEIKEEQSTITGSYQIKRVTLDFEKDSASSDIYDVDTKEHIKGLIIQTKSLYDGSFKVLKTAQDKQAIKLQLIITMRNDKLHKAVLDKIL